MSKQTLKSTAVVRYPKVPQYVQHVFKPITVKGYSSYIQEQKNQLQILKNNPLFEQYSDVREMQVKHLFVSIWIVGYLLNTNINVHVDI